MRRAFIFPGQGSQATGMGKDLFDQSLAAKEVFDEVDESLGQKLSSIIFEGDVAELTMTENTQPALMAVSMAAMMVMKKEFGFVMQDFCEFAAGHSLGEYSALAATGALSISDTARLLRIRGRSMQDAVPPGIGAMAAIIADFETSKDIISQAAEGEICEIANYNSPEQIVISGHVGAIDRAIKITESRGKRAIKLNVSAPFHSSLINDAAKKMQSALSEVNMLAPDVPIICNITAEPSKDPTLIKDLLVKQVTGMVRWYDTIIYLKSMGVTSFVEVGSGKVLAGIIKRIDKSLEVINIQNMSDIESFMARL